MLLVHNTGLHQEHRRGVVALHKVGSFHELAYSFLGAAQVHEHVTLVAYGHHAEHIVAEISFFVILQGNFVVPLLLVDNRYVELGELAGGRASVFIGHLGKAEVVTVAAKGEVQRVKYSK